MQTNELNRNGNTIFRFFFYFLSEIVLLTLTTKAPNDDQNIEKTIFFNRNKSNQCEICSATPILNSFFQNRIITLKSNFPKAKSYTCVCSVQFCFFFIWYVLGELMSCNITFIHRKNCRCRLQKSKEWRG